MNIIIDNNENERREVKLTPLQSISIETIVVVPKDSYQRQVLLDEIPYEESIKLIDEVIAADEY